MALHLGPDFELEVNVVTQTIGILAVKRVGKSNAAVVMAEEMYAAGIPWVAIDPKGDWWGVRSSGDGDSPGLAIPVFGGEHGDVPLEPTGGNLVADLIADNRLTCVLDVSEMTKADQRRFLTDFALRLYKRNRDPLHIFCEEADEYIPQMVRGDAARMVGAFETLVKRGGFRGIGVTLITQRSASLNKDVLTQVGTLIAMRTTSPQDRKAVSGWIEYHAESGDALSTLSSLGNGEAWVFSPEWLRTLKRVQFRKRRTFDSGSTPEVGKARREPTGLADVDLGAIKEAMADTVERAKESDPTELRKRVRDLERKLAQATSAIPEPQVITETIEVQAPFVPPSVVAAVAAMRTAVEAMVVAVEEVAEMPTYTPPVRPTVRPQRPAQIQRPSISVPGNGTKLPGAQKKLLTVLATYGPRSKRQLALQAGYAESGGGFNNPLGALRSSGYVERGDPIAITEAGLMALGDYDPLPTGQALIDHWMSSLPGACKKILMALIEHGAMAKVELAEMTGYEPTGGGFNNPLGRLRTLGLIDRGEPIDLTPEFAEAIA